MTSAFAARNRLPEPPPAAARSVNAVTNGWRQTRNTGKRPQTRAVAALTAVVKPTSRRSRWSPSARPVPPDAMNCSSTRVPITATSKPSAPASPASSRLSVND